MTEDLDPKLQEFESKLRRLKPLDVNHVSSLSGFDNVPSPSGGGLGWGHRVKPLQAPTPALPHKGRGDKKKAYLSATAIAVLLIVCLIPQPHPVPVLPKVEHVVVNEPPPIAPPTIRQQLAQMIDEMYAGVPIAETKPEYPVVEIVVCDAPVRQNVTPQMYSHFRLTRALDLYEL